MGALLDRSRLRALLARWVETPGARVLAALGFTPNRVTLLGVALSGVAGWLVATDRLVIAGGVFLFAGFLDLLDGALARRTGAATRFGGFLDSVGDRLRLSGGGRRPGHHRAAAARAALRRALRIP